MAWFKRDPSIKIHLLIRGRIGEGWHDVDERLAIPVGTTLAGVVALADARGLPLGFALAHSPHLAQTLMLNGERCPIDRDGDRVLADGDELYLLAPLAGG
jgi:molybdopterin converting factor small subunit